MTPEVLEDLVLTEGDAWPLQQACADLDEKARAKLSSAAQKLHRQLSTCKASEAASERLKALLARRGKEGAWRFYSSPENNKATMALFALGPLSAVKKRGLHVWGEQSAAERILTDRRPPWIDDWIAHELEQDFTWLDLPTILAWMKSGVCRKPEVEGYYRKFAAHLMRARDWGKPDTTPPPPPLSQQLIDEPSLLEDVWALFKVETIAFNTNGWLTSNAAPDYETWPDALVKLSAQGALDRERLMRAALDGLRLDIKENQLAGFHRFYVQMTPTSPELLRHQSLYIDLLCHPVGHVAKFAIEMLTKVEKLGALDADPVLREIPGVFAGAGKGNAMAALTLIQRTAARDEGAGARCLSATVEALRHANADVQAKALTLLEANAGRLEAAHLELIAELEGFVAASNRARLLALVDHAPASERLARAERVPVVSAPSAPVVTPPEAYIPIGGDVVGRKVLSADAELTPIPSVDGLIDAVLHAIEVVDSPDDIELIIDAISRFAGGAPPDFEQRVAPLTHRLEHGRTGSNGLGAVRVGAGLAVIDLIFSWARGQLYRTESQPSQYYTQDDAFEPMIAHLRAVAERAARRESRTLLSAPTHRGGWIDPLVWMDRLHELASVAGLGQTMDFRLSLLRLAPDNRAEALERADALPAPLRRIVVFALGGDEMPAKEERHAYAAMITAARCRAPLADWSAAFASLDLEDEWPDGLRPARYGWRSTHKAGQYQETRWKTPEFHVTVSRDGEEALAEPKGGLIARLLTSVQGRVVTKWSELPTAALCRRMEAKHYSGDLNTVWVAQWLAYLWPQNPAGAQMKGASKLAERIDENSSNWTPGFGFLHSLFQKNRPWGEVGHLLLCLGLIGKDADVKGLAVDALIEGIEGRVFDPRLFAEVMARLGEGKWGKLNRLGEGLMQVVQVSTLHAGVVCEALEAWLPRLDFEERSAVYVLQVLLEARALTGRPLAASAQAALREVGGSGKAAKLAKDLLRV